MSRVDEIRARLDTARRAWSFIGAIGVAKNDVVYLLRVADAAEELERELLDEAAEGKPYILRTYKIQPKLEQLQLALRGAPPSAAVATGGARVGAVPKIPPFNPALCSHEPKCDVRR